MQPLWLSDLFPPTPHSDQDPAIPATCNQGKSAFSIAVEQRDRPPHQLI